MLRALRIPIGWTELIKRTFREVMADNCLGLAAQLAYYFFLALFPALLFMVALIGFLPVGDVMNTILSTLGRVAPGDVLTIIQDQVTKITEAKSGGLLTIGALGALWSTSAGVTAIIDTLNQTYDLQESRPWWKVRLIAIGLTVALALFVIVAFTTSCRAWGRAARARLLLPSSRPCWCVRRAAPSRLPLPALADVLRFLAMFHLLVGHRSSLFRWREADSTGQAATYPSKTSWRMRRERPAGVLGVGRGQVPPIGGELALDAFGELQAGVAGQVIDDLAHGDRRAEQRGIGDHEGGRSARAQDANGLAHHRRQVEHVPAQDAERTLRGVGPKYAGDEFLVVIVGRRSGAFRTDDRASKLTEVGQRMTHPDQAHAVPAEVVDRHEIRRRGHHHVDGIVLERKRASVGLAEIEILGRRTLLAERGVAPCHFLRRPDKTRHGVKVGRVPHLVRSTMRDVPRQ